MVAVLVVEVCTTMHQMHFFNIFKISCNKDIFWIKFRHWWKKSKFHIFADNGLTTSGTYHAIIMIKPPAIKKNERFYKLNVGPLGWNARLHPWFFLLFGKASTHLCKKIIKLAKYLVYFAEGGGFWKLILWNDKCNIWFQWKTLIGNMSSSLDRKFFDCFMFHCHGKKMLISLSVFQPYIFRKGFRFDGSKKTFPDY